MFDEKPLKQVIKIKGKINRLINKKSSNPVGEIDKENQSKSWAFKLILYGFLDRVIGKWPTVFLFSLLIVGLSYQR